jgi:hypothetical protein
VVLVPVLVLAVFAAWRVAAVTDHDLALTADSAIYLGTADNLRSGHGPTVPFTMPWDAYAPSQAVSFGRSVPSSHYPPAYPAALAAVAPATDGTRHAARLLDVMFIATNVVLLGLLTARMTNFRSALVAVIPPAICVFAPDTRPMRFEDQGWFVSHLSVASEPLFIAALTVSVLLVAAAVRAHADRAWRALGYASTAAAVATLTRYAGLAVVVSGVAAFLILGTTRLRSRAVRATVFAIGALVPVALFIGYAAARGGGSARPLALHALGGGNRVAEWLGRFVVPHQTPGALRTVLLIAIAGCTVAFAIRPPRRAVEMWADDENGRVLILCTLLTVWAFVDVVLASQTFFDAAIWIGPRILAPIRGLLIAAVVAVAYRTVTPYLRRVGAAAVVVLYALVLAFAGWSAQRVWLFDAVTTPGPTRIERYVEQLPRDVLVVSQDPTGLYLRAHRASYMVPQGIEYLTGRPNPHFADDVAAWGRVLGARGGFVVLVSGEFTFAPTYDDLERVVPLVLVARDGSQQLYAVDLAVSSR